MSKTRFKYIGEPGQIDFDLIVGGILPEEDLVPGQEVEIEDDAKLADDTLAVPRMKMNGLWEEIPKKRGRARQEVVEQPAEDKEK